MVKRDIAFFELWNARTHKSDNITSLILPSDWTTKLEFPGSISNYSTRDFTGQNL
jgi:hypothetical protein